MERLELQKIFEECKDEIMGAGIQLKNGITCEVNDRLKIYGRCRKKQYVEVSRWLIQLSKDEIKNTIVHELLHTLDDTKGHDYKWKYYANIMNRTYGYNIQRCGNITESFSLSNYDRDEKEQIMGYKYRKTCLGCGKIHNWHKASKSKISAYKNGYCRCKCGSKEFKIEDIKLGVKLV